VSSITYQNPTLHQKQNFEIISKNEKFATCLFVRDYPYGIPFAVLLHVFRGKVEECFGTDGSMAEAGFEQNIEKEMKKCRS